MTDTWNTRTKLVHTGARRSQYGEVAEAIYLTQGFVYPDAEAAEQRFIALGEDEFIYARYGNPTVAAFEDRIAALEGAEAAFATASGMAAVNGALFSMLKAGDHIVSAKALFGSCLYIVENLLTRFGVEVTFVDGTDLQQWRDAVRDDTKLVFFESLSNPTLEVIDIQAVSDIAHTKGALVVVDNVFATPVLMRALTLGADVLIYSATKHIDGQGRCLGGVVLGTEDYIRNTLEPYLKHTGGALSPFNAWVMLNGLTTLDLRVRAQSASALKIANALADQQQISNVLYPERTDHPQHAIAMAQMEAGGTVLAIELADKDTAFRFLNALKIAVISNNLGDARSIVTHPSTTTHQRLSEDQRLALGIKPGLVRISVGLEDTDDLIADFKEALSGL